MKLPDDTAGGGLSEKLEHESQMYDVCIIGAGPSGLATLSALHSPYSLEGGTMTESQKERALKSLKQHSPKKRICVVDGAARWLDSWQTNFERLSIQYLRSPALAHPDMFDPHALLSYAVQHGREDELLESGCGDMKKLLPLGQSQIGLWKLPSTKLFVDFCLDLAKDLPHTFVGNTTVMDIVRKSKSNFRLILSNGMEIETGSVVLATGTVGNPITPHGLQDCPHWRHWTQSSEGDEHICGSDTNGTVMVVGGGLTAVQVALNELRRTKLPSKGNDGPCVVLVSKRPLVEKHFDIDVEWFDLRKTNKCVADFYHFPMETRKQALRQARRGGSVPPLYMKQLLEAEQEGRLLCLVGEVESPKVLVGHSQPTYVRVNHCSSTRRQSEGKALDKRPYSISSFQVREIILACGVEPNCEKPDNLTGIIQSKWPIQIESGLPCVTQDLRWQEDLDLFVVGSLGALNIGPDAGNLMGIRRAAQIVANALGSRSWLRVSVLANPFEALDWSDDDDDDDSTVAAGEDDDVLFKKTTNDMSKTVGSSVSESSCDTDHFL
jgi:L-lysine 6-monooxygenase (NADPH-requiring)